jgi:hypothetical protein
MRFKQVMGIIESVEGQLQRDIERGLRQKDLNKATWALAGKEACERIRDSLRATEFSHENLARRIGQKEARQKRRLIHHTPITGGSGRFRMSPGQVARQTALALASPHRRLLRISDSETRTVASGK